MALVSIREGAKLVGKSYRTLYRHIEQGRVTAKNNNNGVLEVDTSELIRVYGEIRQSVTRLAKSCDENDTRFVTAPESDFNSELVKAMLTLNERLELAEKRADKAESLLEKLTETLEAITHRIEYKPEGGEAVNQDKTKPIQNRRKKGKVTSISDILKNMESR